MQVAQSPRGQSNENWSGCRPARSSGARTGSSNTHGQIPPTPSVIIVTGCAPDGLVGNSCTTCDTIFPQSRFLGVYKLLNFSIFGFLRTASTHTPSDGGPYVARQGDHSPRSEDHPFFQSVAPESTWAQFWRAFWVINQVVWAPHHTT